MSVDCNNKGAVMPKKLHTSDFIKHLERNSRIVSSWPIWKQTLLGGNGMRPVYVKCNISDSLFPDKCIIEFMNSDGKPYNGIAPISSCYSLEGVLINKQDCAQGLKGKVLVSQTKVNEYTTDVVMPDDTKLSVFHNLVTGDGSFREQLDDLIQSYTKEYSASADMILADYMSECLDIFDQMIGNKGKA